MWQDSETLQERQELKEKQQTAAFLSSLENMANRQKKKREAVDGK